MKTLLIFLGLIFSVSVFSQLDTVNIGTGPGNHDGEILYTAFQKVNTAIREINPKVEIFLSDTIYVNDSIEFNLYWDNITLMNDSYNYRLSGLLGENYTDYYRFTPDNSEYGLYDYKLYLVNDLNEVILSDSTTIIVDTGNFLYNNNLLIIGDSQTDQNVWPFYLDSLANDSLIFIGTRDTLTSTPNEGYVGRAVPWFVSDTASPFVRASDSLFSISVYLSENEIPNPDIVVINLGTNDIIGSTNTTLEADIEYSLDYLDTLISKIQSDISGVSVYVMTIAPPSYYQDAFSAFGANSTKTRSQFKYNAYRYNEALYSRFDTIVDIIPTYLWLDTKNNMKTETAYANSRSDVIVTKQNDSVHPDSSGYFQFADAVFSAFISKQNTTVGYDIISANLLDGGLERCNACTPDDGISDDWYIWGEVAPAGALAELTETVQSGNYAAKLTVVSAAPNLSLTIPVKENTNYRLSFFSRGDGTNEGRYRVYDLTNAVNISVPTYLDSGVAGTSYEEVIYDFSTNAGTEDIRIYIYAAGVIGAISYFDNFTLRELY